MSVGFRHQAPAAAAAGRKKEAAPGRREAASFNDVPLGDYSS
ncbi:MAG: hypothetical protein R6X34_29425 [Chloroflexota bacterium]